MDKTVKKALSIFFLMVIFAVGAGTAYKSRGAARELFDYKGFTHLKTTVENSIQDNFLFRYGWINVNGLFYRMAGMTIVPGNGENYDVYKLSNGQIMYNAGRKGNMDDFAGKVVKLRDQTEDMGMKFMYVQLPFKIKDDSYMPPGTHTGGNANADELVGILRDSGVDVLDVREEIEKAGLEWSPLFFKTDHHWKPQTGMWTSGLIMEHLGEECGFDVDMSHYDYDSYDKETYSNYMLGAVGRRVGAWYDGLDDIDIVYPKFDTDMSFYGESKSGIDERAGKFEDAVYLWSNIENRSDFVNNSYSTYIGKEYAVSVLTNNKNKKGPRILLVRDSFSCVIQPFIGLDASEVIAIDMRRCKKSVKKICEQYDPDIVVLAYNPSAFSKKQFKFFKK
jgi:hypothetical protein